MLQSVYKPLTKENKVCKKYIFVPGVIAAKIIVENGVSKWKSFASFVSKLTDIRFKKIYISTSWRVIGNFKAEGILKDKLF